MGGMHGLEGAGVTYLVGVMDFRVYTYGACCFGIEVVEIWLISANICIKYISDQVLPGHWLVVVSESCRVYHISHVLMCSLCQTLSTHFCCKQLTTLIKQESYKALYNHQKSQTASPKKRCTTLTPA